LPYRVDLRDVAPETFDRLVDLGAIDIEASPDGGLAALLPDHLAPEQLASSLGIDCIPVSPAIGRDDGSVWVLGPRPIRIGRLSIVPAHFAAAPRTVRLIDTAAFGTGLHPTTALCLHLLDEIAPHFLPDAVLDVGTGSGVLALGALAMGVPRAVGIDIEDKALSAAADNARLNCLDHRLELRRGGPETISGTWPLVLANVLAAPLIEMAPALVQRVGRRGQLVLSGIPASVEPDVVGPYRRLGMQTVDTRSRGGWVALTLRASW
jgi:ribosomal protein L11 methyltransferase